MAADGAVGSEERSAFGVVASTTAGGARWTRGPMVRPHNHGDRAVALLHMIEDAFEILPIP
jgi:hypothetical protein